MDSMRVVRSGSLFQTSDAPMTGEIWIIPGGEDGAQAG
jgi:hypothetical protein